MSLRWAAVSLLFVAASCAGPTDVCACEPPTTRAVLRGTVFDSQMQPVSFAQIFPAAELTLACASETTSLAVSLNPSTDVNGFFTMLLFATAPGRHCVDLLVSSPALAAADTIRGIQVTFPPLGAPPDTTEVALTVPW